MPGMAGMPNPNVPAQMQQFNTPPPFAYGMPPPNFMYPPNTWQMPWQQQAPPIIGADGKPMMPKPGMIDPQVKFCAYRKRTSLAPNTVSAKC